VKKEREKKRKRDLVSDEFLILYMNNVGSNSVQEVTGVRNHDECLFPLLKIILKPKDSL
jgi:hypothetical protein